ncbi:MAG: hypothetical protein MZV63_68395 [Marinilabiliales bacterium]|nr:hypothetical protein [Marinilabiliales bacterium]
MNYFSRTIKKFPRVFWISNLMELFERWGWYAFYNGFFAIYLTSSPEAGALGFSNVEKGTIMGTGSMILYFLPVITGAIADRVGYKKVLITLIPDIYPFILHAEQVRDLWFNLRCIYPPCRRRSTLQANHLRHGGKGDQQGDSLSRIRNILYGGQHRRIHWPLCGKPDIQEQLGHGLLYVDGGNGSEPAACPHSSTRNRR